MPREVGVQATLDKVAQQHSLSTVALRICKSRRSVGLPLLSLTLIPEKQPPLDLKLVSDEGRLVRCSPGDLSVEDIIDVRIFLDIAFFKGPDTVPRPLINWSFDQVILTSKEKSGLEVSMDQ